MPIAHLLVDFSTDDNSDGDMKLMSDVALEDQRLASFEQGYSAGWEDATSAQTQDQSRVSAALATSLEDLSFTYHEAMTQMMGSVEPLFQCMVDLVLPDIMANTIGQHIVEQLCDMARNQTAQPATLIVPIGTGAALKPILAQGFTMPVEISEDEEMVPGSARLRLGTAECELNSEQLLSSVRQAVDAFLYQMNEELLHG